ncbi:MAG: hypothetical protein OQK98_10440 [Gammaproteobacteria bacterium]|nr:hypothetical protein [Gammaproteobacteria bacterium]
MLINSQLVKDHFGQYYKIQTSKDKPAPLSLESEVFRSKTQAAQFINNLTAPISFWSRIVNSETLILKSISNEKQLKEEVAELFNRGKIKAFKIDISSSSDHPPEKRTVTDSNKNNHTFTPVSSLLISNPKEIKKFSNKTEAEKYLNELSADKDQLKNIAQELNLGAGGSDSEVLSSITTSLESGLVVIVVDRYSAPPSTKSDSDGTVRGDQDASKASSAAVITSATEEDICNCTIKTLTAKCKHGRTQNEKGILQVVPTPVKTRSEEYELMGVKVTLKEEYAGDDEIECSVDLQNNKSDACFYITDETNELVNKQSSKIIVKGENKKKLEKWPIDASPEKTSIQGHGCDKAGKTIYIESYPSQYYTIQGDLSIFKVWTDSVNEGWETWGKSIFSLSPVELAPKITPPTGSFSANWGWKENNDWKAYYNVSSDFGLNPILGVEIKVILSMGTLALTAAGIPPNVAKLAAEHLLDIQLSAAANCKASLTGKPAGKFYTDGSKEITGEAKFSTEGGVVLELLARAGSDYVVSVSLSVSGEAKVTGEDVLALDKTGLFLQTNIMLSPFIGTAKVTVKYFKIRSKTRSKKWEPWKQIEIYKSDNKKILPR